ncbi:MAG: hypothetical protein ACRC2O_04020, partial [Chitinophagaceae bacterium]
MLLSNYSAAYHASCGREIGSQNGAHNLFTYYNAGTVRNFYTTNAGNRTEKANLPSGNRQPYAYVWAPKAGELSSTTYVNGNGELVGSGSLGFGIDANLTGDGGITNAALGLIVSAAADLTGNGNITGDLLAFLNGSATLDGTSSMTANLGALADLLAAISGSGDLVSGVIAKGQMSADIVVTGTGLTLENVREAVWSAIAAEFNEPGTMGNKMNSAASAGDPWSTLLPGSYADGEAGKILAQIQTLVDELHK